MRKHVHAESQKSYFLKYQNMRFLKKFLTFQRIFGLLVLTAPNNTKHYLKIF